MVEMITSSSSGPDCYIDMFDMSLGILKEKYDSSG